MGAPDLVANVVGGVVAFALLVHLVVALLRPERFSR
ncbi:K(+)-transporting ATPase subunit F [Pseudonocardia nematodicida]|uniref:K(+)-transporting ATPase subunit F n=1 Tax=Pseudonocardia nematodicida TaxID=1206997 RepID=A0ABV1KK55_9PSEU